MGGGCGGNLYFGELKGLLHINGSNVWCIFCLPRMMSKMNALHGDAGPAKGSGRLRRRFRVSL